MHAVTIQTNTISQQIEIAERLRWRIIVLRHIISGITSKTGWFANYSPLLHQARNQVIDAFTTFKQSLSPSLQNRVVTLNTELVRITWMLDCNSGGELTFMQEVFLRTKPYTPEKLILRVEALTPFQRGELSSNPSAFVLADVVDDKVTLAEETTPEPSDSEPVVEKTFANWLTLSQEYTTLLRPDPPDIVCLHTFLRDGVKCSQTGSPVKIAKQVVCYWEKHKNELVANLDALASGDVRARLSGRPLNELHAKHALRGEESMAHLTALADLVRVTEANLYDATYQLQSKKPPSKQTIANTKALLDTLTHLHITLTSIAKVYREMLTSYEAHLAKA